MLAVKDEVVDIDDEPMICDSDVELEDEKPRLVDPPDVFHKPADYEVLHRRLLLELPVVAEAFKTRRFARQNILRRLAEDAVEFQHHLKRRSAELRAQMVTDRLELLRLGDVEGYAALLAATKESRLSEILEETQRIVAELMPVSCLDLYEAVEQPRLLRNGRLLPHQLQGLQWLVNLVENGLSGILADDMGLGKTVQTLALFAHLAEKRKHKGPYLIVVPLSTLSHWSEEIDRWLPSFRHAIFRGSGRKLDEIGERMLRRDVDIVLTTFEVVSTHIQRLVCHPWHSLVVDEGHRLKNLKTRFNQACRSLSCRHRFVLTGTPLQNSLRELWSLLTFVAPRSFASVDDFEQWFALPPPPSVCLISGEAEGADLRQQAAKLLSEEEELLIIQRLHSVLRPFLLRRTKDLVLSDLPERREVVIWVPLSPWQKVLYRTALKRVHDKSGRSKAGKAVRAAAGTCMMLRKAVNHPFQCLGPLAAAKRAPEDLVKASGKFEFLDRVLPRLHRLGHKTLVFSQFTGMLDLLEQLLERHKLLFGRLDGTKSAKQRQSVVEAFRQDPKMGVLLLTTRAGGLGLNLQAADTVIICDSDWNPQADCQAMDRAHRIGQQRAVLVIRLLTPTAIDRGLYDRAGHKLDVEKKVIAAGQFHHQAAGDSHRENLLRRLVAEARTGSSRSEKATSILEVNRLLARTPEEQAFFDREDTHLLAQSGGVFGTTSTELCLQRCGRLMSPSEAPNGLAWRRLRKAPDGRLKRKLAEVLRAAAKSGKKSKPARSKRARTSRNGKFRRPLGG